MTERKTTEELAEMDAHYDTEGNLWWYSETAGDYITSYARQCHCDCEEKEVGENWCEDCQL